MIFIVENNGYSMGTAIERGTTMAHDLDEGEPATSTTSRFKAWM